LGLNFVRKINDDGWFFSIMAGSASDLGEMICGVQLNFDF